MGQTRLTFENGQFRLIGGATSSIQDLKGAVPFRRYADEVAEKVFKRTLNQTYSAPRLPPLTFLDSHQLDGVRWLLSRKRSYLGHAPGAGKTLTTIVGFHLSGCDQALVIVPPGLALNWQREIEKWSPRVSFKDVTVSLIGAGTKEVNEAADFLIVADSVLDRPAVQNCLRKLLPKFVAVDEASRLKEITALRSIAFYGGVVAKARGERPFNGLYRHAKHVVLLDGSPMPNGRPMELWASLYVLDPESIDCMDRPEFGVMFCNGHQDRFGKWQYKGSSRPNEFRERIKRRFLHVVTEDQLTHPERRRSLLFMDRDVRSAKHKTWERQHLENLPEISEHASQGEFAKWRRELGVRKVKWVSDYVTRRFKEKSESILLFVWHRDVAEQLFERLSKSCGNGITAQVIGGTSHKLRELIFANFQAGVCKIIIGNIQAMGRGHNLQRADRIVFGEFSWSDELNKQCEKRTSRKGNKKKFVRCEYVVAPNSMDEKVLSSVFNKQRRTKAVIR